MANTRIYFAVQAAALAGDGGTFGDTQTIRGLQSFGITTNFNLAQVFQMGQLELYENAETLPDVEITMSKVLDGKPLMWHLATVDATTPTLAGRSTAKCMFCASVFADTLEAAEGTPGTVVRCSGMYVSSLSYNFPLDGEFTEDMTVVGNDKIWNYTAHYGQTMNPNLPTPTYTGVFSSTTAESPPGTGGVNRRENMQFACTVDALDTNGMAADPDCTILPPEVFGISSTGVNNLDDAFHARLTNITVSADLGRDEINELGKKVPYTRYVTFPLEVTTEVGVTSTSGDMISVSEGGIFTTGTDPCIDNGNLVDRTIRIACCEGTRIYTGARNKLSSVNYGGGDAGGGNVAVTYTFSTFNDLTILHSADPNPSGGAWWAARTTYLVAETG